MRKLIALSVAALCVAGAAPSALAHDDDRSYWGNGNDSRIWRNSYGECWQTGNFNKAEERPDCGADAKPAAPVATPAAARTAAAPAAADNTASSASSSAADDAAARAKAAADEAAAKAAAAAAATAALVGNKDDDGDGVPNKDDACPDSAAGAKVDAKGCYVALKETVTMTLNVKFATGSAKIADAASRNEVKKVADFLTQYPQTAIEIGGHTDNVGSVDANRRLSQARADAVRNELIKSYGIDGGRVTAKGYGPDKPVADNGTADGRAANRRVEGVINQEVEKVSR